MARRTPDARLGNRESRRRLASRGKPHYRLIEPGLHIGYRRLKGRKGRPAVAGTWVARHYHGAGSYVVEKIGIADDFSDADGVIILSFAQAQDKARAHMVRRARDAAGVGGPMTVQSAVESYIEGLSGRAAHDAGLRARAHIYPQLGDIEIGSLTANVLSRWLKKLAATPARVRTKAGKPQRHQAFDGSEEAVRRRKSSANRTWTTLRAACNLAFRNGKTPTDAAWRRVEPFENVDAARIRYLTIEEAKRLVNASEPQFRLLVQAALQTGARYGELCRLTIEDFHTDSGTILVRTSKSGKSRHIILTDEGAALFRQIAAGRAAGEIMLRKADGEPWGTSHQRAPMKQACERARISPPIGIHTLRHTWASLAVMSGMPLMVVARNLGHADTRMVEKHYGHLTDSYVAAAVREHGPKFGIKLDQTVGTLRR